MEPLYVIAIAAAVILAAVAWYISTMNAFARLAVKITESDSGIDVALTKRFDTLTKTLDVCKTYAKHEVETLANLVRVSKRFVSATSIPESDSVIFTASRAKAFIVEMYKAATAAITTTTAAIAYTTPISIPPQPAGQST